MFSVQTDNRLIKRIASSVVIIIIRGRRNRKEELSKKLSHDHYTAITAMSTLLNLKLFPEITSNLIDFIIL